jgi:hypothetical protein
MQLKTFIAFLSAVFLAIALISLDARAQPSQKALTNHDVARMVANGLPESVVLSTIQAGPTEFDTSVDALIALHKGGASKAVLDAMVAAGTSRPPQASEPPVTATSHPTAIALAPAAVSTQGSILPPRGAADSGSDVPSVVFLQGGTRVPIPLERTHLAETKTKPTSLAGLASDVALNQSMQMGVNTVAMAAVMHSGSVGFSSVAVLAGSVFSNMLPRHQPTVTYVWGVPNTSSATLVAKNNSAFEVNFADVRGIHPEEFEPVIVKLTPMANSYRLVGASAGKEGATTTSTLDWPLYTDFLEDRVAVRTSMQAPGQYQISPESALLAGEYAVVLRPISKTKKFSGGDVARAQGDGMIFDSVWSFEIPQGTKSVQ